MALPSKTIKDCQGQPIAIINAEGATLFSCDASIKERLRALGSTAINRIRNSKFSAGSFESGEPDRFLFSYYQPNTYLSVIGVTPSDVAFRPAYFLGLRMTLLIVWGFGLAVLLSVFLARTITGPIETLTLATSRIALGDFDFPIQVRSKNEIRTLADSVVSMSQQIKKLIESEIEKTKLEAQLEVAGMIQRTLLPAPSLALPGFKIESFYQPADECGGDWWSVLELGETLMILIGDVTGHGYASALLVAATRGGVAQLEAELEKSGIEGLSPADILKTLNRIVFDSTQGQLAMTALCLMINRETGFYTIASAAHQPTYLVQTELKQVKTLPCPGSRLGETRNFEGTFKEISGTLALHDKLILSTDGIQDLGKSDEDLLGKMGVLRFFKAIPEKTPEAIVDAVKTELIPLNAGKPFRDDITVVVLERRENA